MGRYGRGMLGRLEARSRTVEDVGASQLQVSTSPCLTVCKLGEIHLAVCSLLDFQLQSFLTHHGMA